MSPRACSTLDIEVGAAFPVGRSAGTSTRYEVHRLQHLVARWHLLTHLF